MMGPISSAASWLVRGHLKAILFVDHDPITTRIQAEHSYLVRAFVDPELALLELEEAQYDMAIIDLNASGWELLRIVKDTDNGWSNLKVIITTTSHEPEQALKAWNLGADYYVTKPYGQYQLSQLVEQALYN